MTQNNPIADKLDDVDKLLQQGKYPDAIRILEKILQEHPEEEPVLLRLAWANWDAGNKDRSIIHWEMLLDRELRHKVFTGFAYDELVRIYKQEGSIDRLIHLCEKAVGIQPDDVGLLTELGSAYLMAGKYDKACDAFRTLMSMEEDNPVFACRLGESLLGSGHPEACIGAFERAAQIDPEDADRYFFLAADLFMKRRDAERAAHLLERCLDIAPSEGLYFCSLGDVLITLGRIDDAFAAYEKAGRHNNHHAGAYFNRLGNTLMKAALFSPAIRAFEAALAIDATIPCRTNLDRAYKESGQDPL